MLNHDEIVKSAFKYIIDHWVVNFKLGKKNSDFKLENRKKILTIAIYEYSLNVQKYYVEKAQPWRDSEARIQIYDRQG